VWRGIGHRKGVENKNGLERTWDKITLWLILVKDNLLVIRMDVCNLTHWGSSWLRPRVCGRGGIRKNCGNRWKSQKPHLCIG